MADVLADFELEADVSGDEVTPLNKVVTGAAVGTVIEYYDFGIYSALAVYLGMNFFPQENPELGILLAVASTGTAFLVRPLGGALFGVMSDRIGRKFTFMVTLLLMSCATILMGLVPTYAAIGILAPVLILLLRVAQGLAVGGEYAAASTYVVEHAPDRQRGYYTGWLGAMTSASLLLALLVVAGVQAWLGREAFDEWGWRVPFLGAAILLVLALVVRSQLRESPIFVHLKKTMGVAKTPLRDILNDPSALGLTLAVAFGICAPQISAGLSGSMLALYMLQTVASLDAGSATLIIAAGCFFGLCATVFFGWLSDQLNRKKVQMAGMILGIIIFLPLFRLLIGAAEAASSMVWLWICLLQIPGAMIVGPGFAAMTEAFPASRRATSVALSFSIGGIVGGFAPGGSLLVGQLLNDPIGGIYLPIFIFTIGTFVYWKWVPDQSGRRIWDDVLGSKKENVA